jgi:hypothetical protein
MGENLYHTLTIRRDGSARFYVGRRDIDTPPGTFDFGSVRDRLLAASPDVPGGPANWWVAFHHSGQYGQRARAMTDAALARELNLCALDVAASDDPDVEAKRRRLLGSS